MNKETQEFYKNTRNYFHKAMVDLRELDESINSLNDMADAVYALREIDNYIEKLRKEMNKYSETYQTAACLMLISRHRKAFKTEYCSAKKETRISTGVPSKSTKPKEYQALLEYLGVPQKVIDDGLLAVHWPNFSTWITERQKKGEPRPPGLGEQSPHFELGVRTRKSILEESEVESNEVPF